MADVWGFEREVAERLKEIAGENVPINRVQLYGRRRAGAIGGGIVAKTPSGGIAAATFASGEYTFGTAACALYTVVRVGSVRKAIATGDSIDISNSVPIAIKGNALIHAKLVDGEYLVDVEPCTITYLEPSADPGSGGGG